jgi:hypothetical protein
MAARCTSESHETPDLAILGRKVYPIREAGEEKSIGLIVTSGRSDLRSKSAAEKIYVCRRGSENVSTE